MRVGWSVKVPEYTVIHKRIKKLGITIAESVKKSGEKKFNNLCFSVTKIFLLFN